jgi:uncharacterized membrane protein
VKTTLLSRWQANFWAGLAIVLPGVISVAVLAWLYRNVVDITDVLLILLPREWTHQDHGNGPLYWYWSVVALALAIFLIGAVGVLARYYFGKRLIEWVEATLLRIPVLNKLYGAMRQVNEAFTTGNKSSFRTVVMVEFPQPGMYSVGFLTTAPQGEVREKTHKDAVSVFIPMTPNATSGFLVLVPENKVRELDMTVTEALKYVISLGSIAPESARTAKPAGTS